MGARKKVKPERVKKVVYDRVRFTFPEVFGEEFEFDLPNIRQQPNSVARNMEKRPFVLTDWLADNSAPEMIEAFDLLQGDDENRDFMRAWAKASGVDLGKSED